MRPDDKIYVAGHRGLVGSALLRRLEQDGYANLPVRTSEQLDLRDQNAVREFFRQESPDYVFLAAAKVGGIYANDTYPAEFIHDNLLIQNNVIHQAHLSGVKKLLFLGSSCIYPKHAPQPMKEEYLLDGKLEPTNASYAIAKIAGIAMCQAYHRQYGSRFISVMPTNLYGPNDNYDLKNSHVLPALLRKFHEAKASNAPTVTVWGTGSPRREFLHADDLASACLYLMKTYDDPAIVNIGWGEDLSIAELAQAIAGVVGYSGQIVWDKDKPDGTPRKLLDTGKLASLGWTPGIRLAEGLRMTYQAYLESYASVS